MIVRDLIKTLLEMDPNSTVLLGPPWDRRFLSYVEQIDEFVVINRENNAEDEKVIQKIRAELG
jgi:hypothetical protein